MIALIVVVAVLIAVSMWARLWAVRNGYFYRKHIGRSRQGRGYIYFFRGARENFLHVKIGRSVDPIARLKAFKTANPYGVHIHAVVRVKDPSAAEWYIHSRFIRQRIAGGEWFWWSPALWIFVLLVRDKKLTERIRLAV